MAIADMYLKITEVTGEALADQHVTTSISSRGSGECIPRTMSTGGPSGAAQFILITVTKRFDRSTPTLFQYLETHKLDRNGTLVVRKASGGPPLEYVTIEMDNVRIVTVECVGRCRAQRARDAQRRKDHLELHVPGRRRLARGAMSYHLYRRPAAPSS